MWGSHLQFKSSGMALLSAVLLLLILAALVTAYVSRVKSIELQILNNVQSRKLALNAANKGLNHTLATLQAKPDWSSTGTGGTLSSGSHFVVQTTDKPVPAGTSLQRVISISSKGTTSDGLTHANVVASAVIYPIVARVPPAPVMIGGGLTSLSAGMTQSSHFVVGVNNDGLGQGKALALWTAPIVSRSIGLETCHPGQISLTGCGINTLSHSGVFGSDVLDNNKTFPADLWLYVFNLNASDVAVLEQEANIRTSDCSSLSSQTSGFIWVHGDCVVAPGVTLGSSAEPVLLVVVNGSLTLQAGVSIHGLVFWAVTTAKNGPFHISSNNSAVIHGALVANQLVDTASTKTTVIYDKNALNNLQQKPFTRATVIPGSWRDF